MDAMMTTPVEQAMHNYSEVYQKLYGRKPCNFRALNSSRALVGGIVMDTAELEARTARLEREYSERMGQKRENVVRLIDWCKQPTEG